MESIFSQVLNMSLTGSLVIVLVLLARLALRRVPKVFSYALWSVVLFRLLCPVALTGPASVLSPLRPQARQTTGTASVVTYLPASRQAREPAQLQQTADEEPAAPDDGPDLANLAAKVWAAGALGLLLWSFLQYFRLRLRLLDAVRWRRNVYLAEGISTAFVMGYLAPKIYLPFHVPKGERRFILAHERHHLRRGDHLVKLLAYLALCVHWFNPLAWVAFLQAGKDMEMSCDEAVLRRLGPEIRADYASALLRLSASRRIPAGMPLAFGEGDTKGRIMNMAKWKKPRRWVSAICLVLCAFVLIACAMNPVADATGSSVTLGQLPEGLTYTRDGRDLVFIQDGQTVGGVTVYDIPEGAYDPGDLDWPAKVGIPDYQAEGLWRMSEGSVYPVGEAIDVEFGSDVPPGEEATEHRRHTLVKVDDTLYDIWMDRMKLDSSTCYALLSAVKLPGVDDVTFTVPETIPASALPIFIGPLPDGYAYTREGSGVRFTKDGATIGGVDRYVLAEGVYDPADEYFHWLANVGIPDYEDDSLTMMGSSGQDKREWIVVFSSDVPQGQPVTVERRHHFTVEEPMLYDVWFDALAVDMETISELYNAVILPTA